MTVIITMEQQFEHAIRHAIEDMHATEHPIEYAIDNTHAHEILQPNLCMQLSRIYTLN